MYNSHAESIHNRLSKIDSNFLDGDTSKLVAEYAAVVPQIGNVARFLILSRLSVPVWYDGKVTKVYSNGQVEVQVFDTARHGIFTAYYQVDAESPRLIWMSKDTCLANHRFYCSICRQKSLLDEKTCKDESRPDWDLDALAKNIVAMSSNNI